MGRASATLWLVAGAALLAHACKPDFGDRPSFVGERRVLAVRADPPEAAPGTNVSLSVLVATPSGTDPAPSLGWAFCATAKPLTENDVVPPDCLGAAVIPIGAGTTTNATIPSSACQLYGPEPPPGGYRPRNPDVTGGWYQPVRATLEAAAPTIALVRLRCNLASAPADAATDFKTRYKDNQNPTLAVDVPTQAARGAHVTFHASWRPEDREAYVAFDLASQAVVSRREEMRVSWFVSAGTLDADHGGRTEADVGTTTDDGWTAPDVAGAVHVWIVLRDSRGGVAWTTADVAVP